jgi:transcriptional regulator GlxA family with amidase domain
MHEPTELALLTFPYRTLHRIQWNSDPLRAAGKSPGAAAVWCMTEGDPRRAATSLAVRPGGLSLLVILPPHSTAEGPRVSSRAELPMILEQLRPQAILPHHISPALEDLCQVLRRPPSDLAGDLADYVRWRGLRIDRDTIRMILRILDLSADLRSISAVARSMYTSRRALGRRFASQGLPVPSHWLQIGRLMRVAVRLQNSDATIGAVAREHGYPDGFSLSNQMERLTGYRPSFVRRRLGWEWLLESWLRHEAGAGRFSALVPVRPQDFPGSSGPYSRRGHHTTPSGPSSASRST